MSTRPFWALTARTTAGFALALAFLVAAGVGGLRELAGAQASGELSRRTRRVIEAEERVLVDLIDAERGERGYLLGASEGDLASYERSAHALAADAETLRRATDGDPAQRARFAALGPLVDAELSELEEAVEQRRAGGRTAALAPGRLDRIRAALGELRRHEAAQMEQHLRGRRGQTARLRAWTVSTTLIGVVLAGLTLLGLERQTRRRAAAERATLEERARIIRAEAEKQAHDQFLAVLSHELRSPLHAMLGWLRILEGGLAAGRDVRRAVETIDRNIQLQTRLVDDLLDISRALAGKLSIEERPADLALIAGAAVENARPAAEAKGIELHWSAPDVAAGPVVVTGDERRLLQVIGNLLNNALKFTPAGGRITVTLAREGGEASLQVADTGAGIAPDFLPRVFDRFRQADASATRTHGGLGLGLAIVKTLCELQGGRAEARSAGLGQGSTFTVRLPFPAAPLPLPAPRSHEPGTFRGMVVVLLDDDTDGREALRLALEATGAEVHACSSADEARRVLDRTTPDVIVSDLGLPGESGYDFVRALRARDGAYVPAVAISGFAGFHDREEAARSGFDDHLAKPIDADALCARLREVVGRASGRAS